jgi:hypothetical protein
LRLKKTHLPKKKEKKPLKRSKKMKIEKRLKMNRSHQVSALR